MDLLNNAWVVGIGGGILSGLFVAVVTRYAFSRRDNREYAQKIEVVNREVVYALRPGISEGRIPSGQVLESLLNATARRHKVSREDIYRPKQIAEELIKEIMDSSFISSDTKTKYCETLAHFVTPPLEPVEKHDLRLEQRAAESDYRSRMASRMSAILGLTAAMVTMSTVFSRIVDKQSASIFGNAFEVLVPTLTVLLATAVAMAAMLSAKRIRDRANRDRSESGEKGGGDKLED